MWYFAEKQIYVGTPRYLNCDFPNLTGCVTQILVTPVLKKKSFFVDHKVIGEGAPSPLF